MEPKRTPEDEGAGRFWSQLEPEQLHSESVEEHVELLLSEHSSLSLSPSLVSLLVESSDSEPESSESSELHLALAAAVVVLGEEEAVETAAQGLALLCVALANCCAKESDLKESQSSGMVMSFFDAAGLGGGGGGGRIICGGDR